MGSCFCFGVNEKKSKKVVSDFSLGELKKNKKSGRWLQHERNGKLEKGKKNGKLLWLWGKWKKIKKSGKWLQLWGVGELGVFDAGLASQRPAAAARLGYVNILPYALKYGGQQS